MWLKLSDDHGDECARAGLSDAAFRTHVEALLWTMRRETDGRIDARDVRRFAESPDAADAVRELLLAGFWRLDGDGWQIVQAMQDQPEHDVIEARRRANAERQRRKRRKAAQVAEASRRDDHRDDTRDPGRDGTGRDGSTEEGEISHAREGAWRCQGCGVRRRDLGFDLCSTCRAEPVPVVGIEVSR